MEIQEILSEINIAIFYSSKTEKMLFGLDKVSQSSIQCDNYIESYRVYRREMTDRETVRHLRRNRFF